MPDQPIQTRRNAARAVDPQMRLTVVGSDALTGKRVDMPVTDAVAG